jgi:hypothetical protein
MKSESSRMLCYNMQAVGRLNTSATAVEKIHRDHIATEEQIERTCSEIVNNSMKWKSCDITLWNLLKLNPRF